LINYFDLSFCDAAPERYRPYYLDLSWIPLFAEANVFAENPAKETGKR